MTSNVSRPASEEGRNPVGVVNALSMVTQGSSFLRLRLATARRVATLGFDAQSLWDWVSKRDPLSQTYRMVRQSSVGAACVRVQLTPSRNPWAQSRIHAAPT